MLWCNWNDSSQKQTSEGDEQDRTWTLHEIQYPDVNSAHMCIALDCPVLLSLFIHLCPHRASTLLTYYPTLVLTKHKQSCPGTNKQSPRPPQGLATTSLSPWPVFNAPTEPRRPDSSLPVCVCVFACVFPSQVIHRRYNQEKAPKKRKQSCRLENYGGVLWWMLGRGSMIIDVQKGITEDNRPPLSFYTSCYDSVRNNLLRPRIKNKGHEII